jgi:hypothetical protein
LQRCEVVNQYVQGLSIDNTGMQESAQPGPQSLGTSRLMLSGCDTPLVADNLFEREDADLAATGHLPHRLPAGRSSRQHDPWDLRGRHHRHGQTETSVTNNLIEKCPRVCGTGQRR